MVVCMCESCEVGKICCVSKFPIPPFSQSFNEHEMVRAAITECRGVRQGRRVFTAMEKGWRRCVSEQESWRASGSTSKEGERC